MNYNKKIVIMTAIRADYGILSPIIRKLIERNVFDVRIAVTGAHLSPEFGLTYNEIICDGFEIDKKIEILLSSDTPMSISKSMGLAMISFAEYFDDVKPDALMVLGDRYETLAVCCAALNAKIPIIHLYGGETTEGAVDEAARHSISKMSYLHFTATEDYRRRVIQLGESPERVFNVGAVGAENAVNTKFLTRDELCDSLGFDLSGKYAVVTFHPVTLEQNSSENQFKELLAAVDSFKNIKFIFTKANADADGRIINSLIDDYVSKNNNSIAVDSLGSRRYLSTVKYAAMVIGNSSSALVEVPSFKIPTINIGDRQRGRIQGKSVLNCEPKCDIIVERIKIALSDEFNESLKDSVNPYANINTCDKIVDITIREINKDNIDLKKKFYDTKVDIDEHKDTVNFKI